VDVQALLPGVPSWALGRRVTREVFGRVWETAEQRNVAPGPDDCYLVGVLRTLRWLARVSSETPVTRVVNTPLPEICDTEYMAALAAARSTKLHPSRVEVARGAVAALGWMYHGQPEPAYSSTLAYESESARI
jgi:hypothetical protein